MQGTLTWCNARELSSQDEMIREVGKALEWMDTNPHLWITLFHQTGGLSSKQA